MHRTGLRGCPVPSPCCRCHGRRVLLPFFRWSCVAHRGEYNLSAFRRFAHGSICRRRRRQHARHHSHPAHCRRVGREAPASRCHRGGSGGAHHRPRRLGALNDFRVTHARAVLRQRCRLREAHAAGAAGEGLPLGGVPGSLRAPKRQLPALPLGRACRPVGLWASIVGVVPVSPSSLKKTHAAKNKIVIIILSIC